MRAAFRDVAYNYLGRPIIDNPYQNVRFLTRTLELRYTDRVLLLVNPIQIWGFRASSYQYEDEEIRYTAVFRDNELMYIKTKTRPIRLISNVEERVFHSCRVADKLTTCRVMLDYRVLTIDVESLFSPRLDETRRYMVPDMRFEEGRKYVYEMARRLV